MLLVEIVLYSSWILDLFVWIIDHTEQRATFRMLSVFCYVHDELVHPVVSLKGSAASSWFPKPLQSLAKRNPSAMVRQRVRVSIPLADVIEVDH
jgi:hypothetical protein